MINKADLLSYMGKIFPQKRVHDSHYQHLIEVCHSCCYILIVYHKVRPCISQGLTLFPRSSKVYSCESHDYLAKNW